MLRTCFKITIKLPFVSTLYYRRMKENGIASYFWSITYLIDKTYVADILTKVYQCETKQTFTLTIMPKRSL